MFRGEDEDAGEREKGEGVGGCVAPSGASSGEQVSRRWPERARARRAQEVEDGGDCGGLGRTVLDQHRSWAGSGGLHG